MIMVFKWGNVVVTYGWLDGYCLHVRIHLPKQQRSIMLNYNFTMYYATKQKFSETILKPTERSWT